MPFASCIFCQVPIGILLGFASSRFHAAAQSNRSTMTWVSGNAQAQVTH